MSFVNVLAKNHRYALMNLQTNQSISSTQKTLAFPKVLPSLGPPVFFERSEPFPEFDFFLADANDSALHASPAIYRTFDISMVFAAPVVPERRVRLAPIPCHALLFELSGQWETLLKREI